jgi:hypothetical protein
MSGPAAARCGSLSVLASSSPLYAMVITESMRFAQDRRDIYASFASTTLPARDVRSHCWFHTGGCVALRSHIWTTPRSDAMVPV